MPRHVNSKTLLQQNGPFLNYRWCQLTVTYTGTFVALANLCYINVLNNNNDIHLLGNTVKQFCCYLCYCLWLLTYILIYLTFSTLYWLHYFGFCCFDFCYCLSDNNFYRCAVLPIYCNLLLCSEVERRIFKAQAADESEARESKPATWGSSEVSCRCCWKSEFHRNFICHLYAVYLSWNNKTSNRNRILERWKFRFQFWLVRRWTILSTVLRRFAMNLELSHWITARMPLLTSTSTYGLGRRRWSSHQQCFVHCLHTISLRTIHKCL